MANMRRLLLVAIPRSVFAGLGAFAYILFLIYYHGIKGAPWDQGFSSEGWWQFLPAEVLKSDPWESLLYLHMRPPLENFWKMVGIQTGFGDAIFALINHICGGLLLIYAALFLGRIVSHRLIGALAYVAFVIVFFPDFLSLFNLPLYNFPIGAIILVTSYHGLSHLRTPDRLHAVVFFSGLAILGLYRETWGFPFLIVAGAIAVIRRQRDAWPALLACLPAAGWIVKNSMIFGFASMSSIGGATLFFNAGTSMLHQVRPDPCHQQAAARILDTRPDLKGLLAGPFQKISFYEANGYRPSTIPRFEEIAALGRFEKDDWWGASNKNAYEYIQLSKEYTRLDLEMIRQCPQSYLRNCYASLLVFLKPARFWAQPSVGQLVSDPYMPAFVKTPGYDTYMAAEFGLLISRGYGLFPWAFAIVILALGIRLLRGGIAERLGAAFLGAVLGTGTLTSILFTYLESNRYKFEIEPLVYVLFWGLLARIGLSLLKEEALDGPLFPQ